MTEVPSPQLTVAETLRRWPELIPLFVQQRLACPGCAMAGFDTLREAAEAHGLDPAALLGQLGRATAGVRPQGSEAGKETEMSPTETLKHEHEIVLLVLEGAEREATAIRGGAPVRVERVGRMVDFFRQFVDRCHHGKEERHLFPALATRGLPPDVGPVRVMLLEHEQGRAAVAAIAAVLPVAETGEPGASTALADALQGYVELLRAHIFKENNVLFPMADQALPPEEQTRLADAFERLEEEEIGPAEHERYHQLAHELAQS
jgi:hybrid cluster-associated redox disulfide protein